jgi:hypothetical protein
MTSEEAITKLESHALIARLTFASGLSALLTAAADEESVRFLAAGLEHSHDRQRLILDRILELSKRTSDIRYRHPWDITLAIHLWLLSRSNLAAAAIAAEVILQTPQCWWASRLASPIVLDRQSQSGAKDQTDHTSRPAELNVQRKGPSYVGGSTAQPEPTPDVLSAGELIRDRSKFARLRLLRPPSLKSEAA